MPESRNMINPKFPALIHGGDYNPDQWLHRPDIIDEDFKLMELAKVNSASLAIFAWAKLEPSEGKYDFAWLDRIMDRMADRKMAAVLATPSGARPAWLAQKYPEVLRVRPDDIRNEFGDRHNHCYTSPVYRAKTVAIDRKMAERYKGHPALFLWHLSNEYGGECHCELCRGAFRGWLKKKYNNNLDLLNEQWWNAFWSHTYTDWDQINPPMERGDNGTHGLQLDWKRFVSDQTIDFMKNEYRAVKEITPDVPVTTNMMGTYPGIDYWAHARALDVVCWDSYPSWGRTVDESGLAAYVGYVHDIYRTLKAGPHLLMESTPSVTNWQEVSKLKRPGIHFTASLQAIAHGADSVQYFQWRKSRGSCEKLHGAVVDHVGHADTRVFREVSEVGSALEKLSAVCGTTSPAEVAVIYDWENRWAVEGFAGVIRNERRNYDGTCAGHHAAFWKQGITVDVPEMNSDFSNYKVLVAPMLYMLKPGVAEQIEAFVKSGRTFVATYLTGIANENDLCFPGGWPAGGLRKVLGIWVEETDGLFPHDKNSLVMSKGNSLGITGSFDIREICDLIHAEGCEALAHYGSDFYAGRPCLTVNKYGKGEAWYVAARTGQDFLDEFYKSLAKRIGLTRNLETDLPAGVTVQRRTDGKDDFLFVMNFSGKEARVELRKGKYEDMLAGADAGSRIVLKPYDVKVLKSRR